jgi:hypothetical protein
MKKASEFNSFRQSSSKHKLKTRAAFGGEKIFRVGSINSTAMAQLILTFK